MMFRWSHTVTNVQIEGESLEQAVLPVRKVDLGIRQSKNIALPASFPYLHSVSKNVRPESDGVMQAAIEA